MTALTLHYIYDPLCGWCYAAGPLVRAVADVGIPVQLHAGGLFAEPTRVGADKRAYMRQSDARIAQMAGVVFGPDYLDGLLADPETIFWSRPPTSAILVAGARETGAELRMLSAVQRAHYVEGRRVADAAVLLEAALPIGLASDMHEAALAAAPFEEHVSATRRLMQRTGSQGFPAFFVQRDGDLIRIDHQPFYGRPTEFLQMVDRSSA